VGGVRVALGLEYNGAAFHGWQSQPGGNTVQDVLQAALAGIAAQPVTVVCAGRTDAGVHALAQVAHFDTEAIREEHAWVRGTNSRLPETVAVRWARRVPQDFHARFSAVERSYRYVLLDAPVRPGLDAGRVGWFHRRLDIGAMQAGAVLLLGEHDFSAFRAAECQAKTPVKTLHEVRVERSGEFVVFDFRANAFLHHMVRNIVGALVYVGKGRHLPQWIGELLAARRRALAAPTFAAAGLYLTGIAYDARWNLPQDGRIIAPSSLPWR
jgi:tRNA pseudouridine38-40 synthase